MRITNEVLGKKEAKEFSENLVNMLGKGFLSKEIYHQVIYNAVVVNYKDVIERKEDNFLFTSKYGNILDHQVANELLAHVLVELGQD